MENKESFNYTYSAKEQEEIKAIRKKYERPKESESSMEKLRRLDESVTRKATVVSLIFGIIGALVMGFGMSLILVEKLGEFLGMGSVASMLTGIPIGIVGIALVALAYPMYNLIVKKERERIAPEILRLTDELMK
ncbi:MAG: hypothetical protein E7648_03290 [Ruminococcaceae bacterium]|nr:hypothetical protein [Oscillospiraceae bacterium]